MNLDLDFSVVTRFARGILGELRHKKLWPAAVVLLAALVAVPLLLSKSPSPTPVAQVPLPTPPPSPATTLPAINEQATPAHSALSGPARDPFGAAAGAATSRTLPAASTVTAVSTAVASTSAAAQNALSAISGPSSATSQSGSSVGGLPTGSGTAPISPSGPPSPVPSAPKPQPAPAGLAPNQSYQVAVAITTPSGGLDTIDPLERLSTLPVRQPPLLVELGVLEGGSRVLFAVLPGAAVKGPGTCVPGPLDCELLSLPKGQTEAVGALSAAGVSEAALFEVTRIRTVDHPSVAAAQSARRAFSAAGQKLLRNSPLSALSLFAYEPSLGAVRDLRNLTVGSG